MTIIGSRIITPSYQFQEKLILKMELSIQKKLLKPYISMMTRDCPILKKVQRKLQFLIMKII